MVKPCQDWLNLSQKNLKYEPLPEIYIEPEQIVTEEIEVPVPELPVTQSLIQKIKMYPESNLDHLEIDKLKENPNFAAENSYLLRALI